MGLKDAPRVGDDAGIRNLLARLDGLETQLRMISAASSGSQANLAFLLGSTISAEATPALTSVTINPADSNVPTTWLSYDPAADAAVTITAPPTGRVAVQAGGYLGLYSSSYPYVNGFIGVEVLDQAGAQVRAPQQGDGNYALLWSGNGYTVNTATGHRHEWMLTGNSTYTLRCRRGFSIGAGTAGAVARVDFQGTAIAVSKIGM